MPMSRLTPTALVYRSALRVRSARVLNAGVMLRTRSGPPTGTPPTLLSLTMSWKVAPSLLWRPCRVVVRAVKRTPPLSKLPLGPVAAVPSPPGCSGIHVPPPLDVVLGATLAPAVDGGREIQITPFPSRTTSKSVQAGGVSEGS